MKLACGSFLMSNPHILEELCTLTLPGAEAGGRPGRPPGAPPGGGGGGGGGPPLPGMGGGGGGGGGGMADVEYRVVEVVKVEK